ncbi:MAG: penicillin acylase family protein [Roseiflexaceae bacterium]
MRSARSVAGLVALAAGVLAGAAAAAAAITLKRPLPRQRGELRLPGLQAEVQILRDHWGVPHIYAANEPDLFRAQGYVHAQDRLWQMEFQRRLAHGRLSEILGALALDTDRMVRIYGFGRVARQEVDLISPAARAALEAYAAGVNAWIEQNRQQLPIEFTLLQFEPEPWTPADTLVWAKVMALNLSGNWSTEILRARLIAALGAERANQLEPRYPADQPLIVPEGVNYPRAIGEAALRQIDAAQSFTVQGAGQGSNNWVVGPSRSASGAPLLANDPHLSISMPSVWYENHLVGGAFQVAGACFPGVPSVVIGHNARIAWGVTNGMNDTQDLVIERFDPADPLRYRFRDEWKTATLVREEIRIKGQAEAHIEEVRVTDHGPIIDTVAGDPTIRAAADEALALRWTALQPAGRIVESILAINQASDWASFRQALANWHVPPQNFVYADVDGNIGYALGGDIPIRAKGDGRLPVPGWTGEFEWIGVVPPAEMPHSYNPPEGFAVSANNRIVSDSFPYTIPGEYLNGYRAARIRELIEQTTKHTAESFARIHADVRSLPGLQLAALAGRLSANTPTERAARDALAAWDGQLTADSIAGTLYLFMRDRLLELAYAEAQEPFGLKTGVGAFASLPHLDFLERATPGVLRRLAERDDAWLPAGKTWDGLLGEAWQATISELTNQFGDQVDQWRYGRVHQLTIRHPLGSVPGLGRLFNRGPFETGGDRETICMGNLPRTFAGAPFYVAPSYRQILDLSDWNRSKAIHPTGQSGHPASPHYADFIQPWLRCEYHAMPWDRPQVEEATVERLVLRA